MSILSVSLIVKLQQRAEAEASRRLHLCVAEFNREFPGCAGARMDFSPSAPDQPSTAGITRDTLQAQVDLLPKQLAAEQQYRPGFNQVNMQSLRDILKGTSSGTKTVQGIDYKDQAAGWYNTNGQMVSPDKGYGNPNQNVRDGFYNPGNAGLTWREASRTPYTTETTVQTEGTPGLLDLYKNDIIPLANQAQRDATTQQREADLADVTRLGPQYREALRNIDPEQTALRDELYKQGMADLMGKGLSAFESQRFQQNYRGANQGRLGDTGASGAGAEAYFMADRERERTMQNRQYAQGLISLDQALYGDPVMQATGRTSGVSPLTGQLFQSGSGTASMPGATLTDPFNALPWQANAVYSNNKTQANIAGSKNAADIYGGMLKSGVSGIMGGLAGMI